MLAVAGHALDAAAQDKYQQLFVFGDSYADLTLSDGAASNSLAPPGLALGLWRVYPVPLAENLGILKEGQLVEDAAIVDVAVGGATASPTAGNPSPLITPPGMAIPGNLPQQVDAFLSADPSFRFGQRDLITINIGGNDGIGFTLAGGTVATAPLAAQLTAASAAAQMQRLVDVGGQTFVLGAFSGLSGLPLIPDPLKGIGDAFGEAYFLEMQKQLLPMAQTGTRFFMLDLHRLGQQVEANLTRYGLVGVICPGFPAPISTPCGPINSSDQQKFFIGPDGLHLTTRGFEIAADYMAKIVMAPDTISVQPGIVMTTTGGFVQSVLGRLDGVRGLRTLSGLAASTYADGPMGLGYARKSRSRRAGPSSRLTTYAMGTFLGGSRDDSADVVGLDYDATSGTAGIEYSVNRNLIVGLAGNYTATNADLNDGAGVDLDAIQAAAYLSYATRQVFAEAIAAYGAHDIGLDRPGVIDTIRSDTDASAFALAARGGYLFDFGSLRAGPIAGLTYIRARVDGYTEDGDDLLTFNVSEQELDSLAGNVGLRFLAPFRTTGGNFVIPYLNVMLEHQFGDDTRTLTVDQVQTTLFLPISTSFPNFETRTYGRVEGGVTFQMGPNVSTTINAASTFARDEANDFRIGAALNYRF